ncbi:hypothetical protein [Streptomyces violaceus]|uniref:ATP/GTP-binding protein n=1 Tax=Streptomyces violaceus TaxID=1936 RepID=A0ABY9UML4_STRVL|nr:hypothetical protein [Streptomyces janthinus]WND24095.1 hypothetical protein RI060_43020 [Streptomyces janthinus]
MASDTVPAAVPGPNEPPHSTAHTAPAGGAQQQPGGFAGLLAPVEPTRTAAFTLSPDRTAPTADGEAVAGASSGAFSHTENPDDAAKNTKNNGAGKQERSVVRAWLLAGAERWRKGADARNKALDIKKAKAQARQVKENVTVNRAEKIVGGSTNSTTGNSSNPGKSLGNKTSKKDSGGGSKNSSGGTSGGGRGNTGGAHKNSSGGSSGSKNSPGGSSGGRGTGSGSGSGSGSGGTGRDRTSGGKGTGPRGKDRTAPGKQQPATPDKRSNSGSGGGDKTSPKKTDSAGKPNSSGGTSGTGKPGSQGPAGKPGKDSPAQAPKPSKTDTAGGKTPTGTAGSDKASKDGKKAPGVTDRASDKQTPGKDLQKTSRGPESTGKPGGDKGKTPGNKTDKSKGPGKEKDGPAGLKPSTDTGKAPTPRIDLQKSREAGYRDGTRAAKVVAHTAAWRDGARDGYRDTTQAADREKTRLDKAHDDRRNARTQPVKDQPVTEPASSADYQQAVPPKPDHAPGPQPIQVTGTDTNSIHLGQHADRTSISRGEVRTLARFQQRLDDKTSRMTQVAEATRTLEHHAKEQIKQVTELLEQARGMEGGEKLVATLTRLDEAAQAQADKAADVHKRAVRGQEACKTLNANTETRYGGIYKAVQDSPDTRPAKMNYYSEMSNA